MPLITLPFVLSSLKVVDKNTFVATGTIDADDADAYKDDEKTRQEKLEKKAIISEDGDLHPFNGKHFGNSGYSGYSMNVDKVKDLGYRPSMLDEWIWKLLDHYIEIVSNENKNIGVQGVQTR